MTSPACDDKSPDHEVVWLQPRCCADWQGEGRLWCEDPQDPCENCGAEWIKFVRAAVPPRAMLSAGGSVGEPAADVGRAGGSILAPGAAADPARLAELEAKLDHILRILAPMEQEMLIKQWREEAARGYAVRAGPSP